MAQSKRDKDIEDAVALRSDAGARRAAAEEALAEVRERHAAELAAAQAEYDASLTDEDEKIQKLKDLHKVKPDKPDKEK